MKKHSAVVVSLHSPREKVWGVVLSIQTSGVTIRGIDLNSFDDWTRMVANGDESMTLSTVFFPMHRVERILLDEGAGEIQSLREVFEVRVGKDLWHYLELSEPLDEVEGELEGNSA
jgi:hypothetical protein